MKSRVRRLKTEWGLKDDDIQLHAKGVADNNIQGIIERDESNNGLGSKIVCTQAEGNSIVVSLDEFLTEAYSFLKADIESWEYMMLKGAAKGIKKNKPLLAICIYHNAVDFYDIPLLIHDLVPEYKIAVRHHSPTVLETVLYAYMPDE